MVHREGTSGTAAGRARARRTRGAGSRRAAVRALAVATLTAVLAAGCGRSDDSEETAETSSGGPATSAETTAPSGPAPGEFGDLGVVCGPAAEGETLEATDVGVTAGTVQIGTISDPGYSGRPGLNQELFDSAEAFSKWCNDAGGINGRKIEVKERDAKLTEYQPRIIEACDEGDFMLVGGGGVFDDQGQKERLECGLPNLAGYVTNPPAVEADLTITPVSSDYETFGIGDLRWLDEQFPDATSKIGILTGSAGVTVTAAQRVREGMDSLGWTLVYDEQFNPAGEASWRGFAEGLKSSGARGVIWTADPSALASLLKAFDEIEYHPDFVRASGNIYDPLLLAEAGEAADNVFLVGAHYPFLDPDLVAENPATEQYLDIIDSYDPGGKVANLGVTGFSAWLLFAKAASACGADLTRDCVWEQAGAITEWSGGGLHARQDLSKGTVSECFVEFEATGGEFQLVDIEPNEGLFNCDPENVLVLTGDYGEGVECENPAFADDPKPSNCAP